MKGILCSSSAYTYKGWIFEIHSYLGPWPLKKDGDPRKRAGKKFWGIWREWSKLTEEEKAGTIIYRGGCKPI